MSGKTKGQSLFTMDTIFLTILGIVSCAFFVQSWTLNAIAATFPKGVSFLAMIFIAYLLVGKVTAFLRAKSGAAGEKPEAGESTVSGEEAASGGKTISWFPFFLLLLLYPVLLLLVGFAAATLVFIVGLSLLMGMRLRKGLIFGVLCTIVLVVMFQYFFQITMPDGWLLELFVQ